MKAVVVVFPGSNCDRDVKVALAASMGQEPEMAWHGESDLPATDLIVLPGGFSYGDYLRSGAMAANSPVMREVVDRAHKGVPVLGICNGFQMLTETGLLPGALMRNANLKFVCKDVTVKVETSQTVFTCGYESGQTVRIPVAHHDGNYVADDALVAQLKAEDRIAFTYDANPNGSVADIAGILSENRRVLGMMPHPERAADPAHGGSDGAPLFSSLVDQMAAA